MGYDKKEALGKLFRGYIKIIGNPQSEYRKEAAVEITEALDELQSLGVSFDELAADSSIQQLLMLTDIGMRRFSAFVREFITGGYDDNEDMSDIASEQIRIARWVKEHKKELIR